jgi:hypothetical protein
VFNAQAGAEAVGHPTTKSWLRWQTQATSATAGGQVGLMRRLAVHPRIAQALAAATPDLRRSIKLPGQPTARLR